MECAHGARRQTRSEEMDAIETETQTEPWMPRGGIGPGTRGVGGETDTQTGSKDELSASCIDRVLKMRIWTGTGKHDSFVAEFKSRSDCLSIDPAEQRLSTQRGSGASTADTRNDGPPDDINIETQHLKLWLDCVGRCE